MVSDSTLVINPQARLEAAKPLRRWPRTHLTNQATTGTGPKAANANHGWILNKMKAVNTN